jgi:branched-subunit amino acid ABC-type transport system permease component
MAQKKNPNKDAAVAAKALETLFATQYVNKKKLYIENFVRGLLFGIGSFLGATIGAALIIWVLSLFSEVPLIGRFVNDIQDTVNSQSR